MDETVDVEHMKRGMCIFAAAQNLRAHSIDLQFDRNRIYSLFCNFDIDFVPLCNVNMASLCMVYIPNVIFI